MMSAKFSDFLTCKVLTQLYPYNLVLPTHMNSHNEDWAWASMRGKSWWYAIRFSSVKAELSLDGQKGRQEKNEMRMGLRNENDWLRERSSDGSPIVSLSPPLSVFNSTTEIPDDLGLPTIYWPTPSRRKVRGLPYMTSAQKGRGYKKYPKFADKQFMNIADRGGRR